MTILYNLILLIIDLAVLYFGRRFRYAAVWILTVFAILAIETAAARIFTRRFFYSVELASYAIFLHGFILLAGSAVVFWRRKRFFAVLSGISSAALAMLVYYVFLIEPLWLEVSHWQITSPKIGQTFRIVVLADLQTDNFGDYERRVMSRVMQEKPDLILFAGDYVQAPYERSPTIIREINAFLREIHLSAPLGAFAVKGNVDPPDWRAIFENTDITAVDVTKTFDLGHLRLTCLELRESYNTDAKMSNPNSTQFHLVLGHVPNFALGRVEGDLLIAGHTHGGQVRLPLIGPMVTLSRIPRSWAAGLTVLPDGVQLLVSRGIGMERSSAPRMRFLCRPELMVIDLTPEKQ